MKFGHEFKKALWQEGFPAHWIESAVPYSQLKKCIKKVENELKSLGLDSETLRHLNLLNPDQDHEIADVEQHVRQDSDAVTFEYDFAGMANSPDLFTRPTSQAWLLASTLVCQVIEN
jgi:hypothetical protein